MTGVQTCALPILNSFCPPQQSATFSQHLVINFYDSLYSLLEENTLGKRLKKARLKLGLSENQISIKCNLSRGAIAGYENDSIHPSKRALIKLTTFIDKNYLCFDEYSKFLLSDYSKIIKEWRINNTLSLSAASKVLGVSSSAIGSWEKGVYSVDKENYKKIKVIIKNL